jgi:cytochrome P450
MPDGSITAAQSSRNKVARDKAYSTPLKDFQVADPELFRADTLWPWFERLRAEDPVHLTEEGPNGRYWSVTNHADIIAVDSHHGVYSSSSELGGITLQDAVEPNASTSFIGLDPPMHDAQRRAVMPMFSTESMAQLEPLIRERAGRILDELPVGETFDFVDKVAVELTSQMLATLFDYPFELRRNLPKLSDMILSGPEITGTGEMTPEQMIELQAKFMSILTPFTLMWEDRKAKPPQHDLISMLAHSDATSKPTPEEYFGNIVLLIVAGSDTTRHSITGGLLALNQNPDEYAKLRANPGLIDSMVPEIIRWQSPVAYMRRTALADTELGGKTIKKGDRVVMWYVSGNRDETAIEDAGVFRIDRERPRQHVGFGFGIHRCVGNRLAEMQLKVMWEELLKRFKHIEVVSEPRRMRNSFVKGYEGMEVRIVG